MATYLMALSLYWHSIIGPIQDWVSAGGVRCAGPNFFTLLSFIPPLLAPRSLSSASRVTKLMVSMAGALFQRITLIPYFKPVPRKARPAVLPLSAGVSDSAVNGTLRVAPVGAAIHAEEVPF